MKKPIFGILSIVCVFSMIHMNGVWAYVEPNCAAGTCQDAVWDSQLGMYMECLHGGGVDSNGEQLTCTCYEGEYAGDYKWQTYDCECNNDQECENYGSNGGYCNQGKCVPCVSYSGGGCSGTTRTKIDDCNYKEVTLSLDCRTGCSSSTSYGCYDGGTDSIGSYECQ